jgi:hypothetical protein
MSLHSIFERLYKLAPTLGWFTETHFVEFPCYPSKIIIIEVQITTVKSFGPIGDDLDIALVLQSFQSQITRVLIKSQYFKEIIVITTELDP